MLADNKMRVALITLGTTLLSIAVVANAFYQKKQFYPSVVYLTKSNPSIAVLYAQVFVLVFLFGKAMRKIFFGQLRAAELEHLIEKFWYVITETCLAFTVFRDDFNAKFIALFTFLLFMKAFHWLSEDRVDYMERSPIITYLFHARVISLLSILGTLDGVLIHHAFRTTLSSGASVQMVFGFEYAILLTTVIAIIMKYVLHTIDYQSEHPWENKNVYLLYAELVTGFVKCCLYITFVMVMVKIHTFPLFAIRPMYLTIRGFKKSLSDVILSRRAIAYMNTRFPDATEEELRQTDNTCIICREQMVVGKKLPCNHIFHTHCLRSWFQRQQSCPTCRMDVLSQRHLTPPQQLPPPPVVPPQVPGFMGIPPPGQPFGMIPPMPPQPPSASSVTLSQTFPTTTTTNPEPSSAFTFPSSLPTNVGNPFMADSSPFMAGPSPFLPSPSPFFLPPFMGMQPPPSIFSPPNIDLSTLSEEQLRHMEGQERENIEARVRVLRNVHSLLDTAIVQLNQYSQAINALNSAGNASASDATNSSSNAPNVTISKSQVSPVMSHAEIPGTSSSVSLNDEVTSSSSQNVGITFTAKQETVDSVVDDKISMDTVLNDMSPENELRRRRLEKFENIKKEKKVENSNE